MRVFFRMMRLVRKHWMLAIAALAAGVSMFVVPPDGAYLGYFDWKTIGCLFCVLAVASALRRAGAFDWAARTMIVRFGDPHALTMTLVLITAVFSMAFTNDVALVIMLPLSVAALVENDQPGLVPVVFSLQALAANLCGMVTPFGNPQNLYLYSYYGIDVVEFLRVMALPFLLSVIGIVAVTRIMTTRFAVPEGEGREASRAFGEVVSGDFADRGRIVAYVILFAIALLAVFRVIPFVIAVVIVTLVLLLADRKALLNVDYALLLTFLCFFVFAGNMARVPALGELLGSLMSRWGLIVSTVTSQIISNVPAAVLLSHFTDAWPALLVGVNIGGAGTFVGSLASLIAIRYFIIARTMIPRLQGPDAPGTRAFLRLFGILNGAFLVVLLVVCQIAMG